MDIERAFIYHIDAKNRITYLNQNWIEFAQENQAPELTPDSVLGKDLMNYIADWETRHLYEIVYDRVRRTGKTVQFPFRCDSPDLRRFFQMSIGPLAAGALKFSVRVIRIETRPWVKLLDASMEHTANHLVICSWCKRIELPLDRWIELEAVLDSQNLFGPAPPSLTHGACPECVVKIRAELEVP